jgi:hypothetical protein
MSSLLNEAETDSVGAFMQKKCLEIPNRERVKSLGVVFGDSELAETDSRPGDLWLTPEVESFCG